MRPLNELVTIDTRFRKSVNLQLDLGDNSKVLEYIPTKSSVAILKRYLQTILGQSAENANILIGPYGKGKSHLMLVLLAVLGGYTEELLPIVEKVERADVETAEAIKNLWKEKKRFLPVLVSGTGNDLNTAFLQALRDAMIKAGLSALAPDSYFSEAEKSIKVWKKEYPATYETFLDYLKEQNYTGAEFRKKLKEQNQEALQLFVKIYPKLTAGSVFQPMLRQEALQVYREVNRKLCEEYGYSGIYLVFDEFSKYIEGHAPDNFSANMKVLQDMCELANNSGDEKLFLTLIAHKSIHEYGKQLPLKIRNAFKGVEGRLKEVRFVVSAKNNYELIADTIVKKEPDFTEEYEKWVKQEYDSDRADCTDTSNGSISDIIRESYELPCFYSLFEKEDYEQIMAKGCFPLTPLCAYALLHLSEKVAQNERTIFTFLTNDEPKSLVRILRKGISKPIGIEAVYDYFKGLFRESADMPQIHNEWLKADYGLSLAGSKDEKKLIKAVAVIRMIHREDEFPAQDNPIRLSLGMTEENYQHAMKGLLDKGIVLYRASLGMYAFKHNVGVDVEAEIRKEAAGLSEGFQICERLKQVSELSYVLPRKYNQEYAMTRYFRYEYMTPEAYLKLDKGNYLFEHGFSDGKIVALISEHEIDIETIRVHSQKLGEQRILISVPERAFSQKENLLKLTAVQRLMENEEFLEENKVLLQELKLYEEDLTFEINAALEADIMPEQGNAKVVYLEKIEEGFSTADFNIYLSNILEAYYEHTPKVNHELLNIQNVTGQYLRARNQVVNAILKWEDCDKYLKGTSPEAMVYRAAFVRTGVVGGDYPVDMGLARVLEEIDAFFMECGGQKQYFSGLYENLQGRHYGVRRGILPLYIAKKLSELDGTAVIYLGKKELHIDADILNRVNEFPEEYQLYIEPESVRKEWYLKELEKMFCEAIQPIDSIGTIVSKDTLLKNDLSYEEKKTGYRVNGHYRGQNRLNWIVQVMQRWYRSLPQYAMVTMEFSREHLDGIKLLRNQLRRAELNPRELLLEKLPKGLATASSDSKQDCGDRFEISQVQENGLDNEERIDIYGSAVEILREVKQELEQALEGLRCRLAEDIRDVFHIGKNVSMKGSLKDWYENQQQKVKTNILSSNGEKLMHYLENLQTNDEGQIVTQLSKEILGLYLEDWNDETREQFKRELQQAKNEIESINEEATETGGMCQIILKDADGRKIEKFYDNQEDSTSVFLKNMIDEALEDFGDSLETNQKVAVLIQAITELLK